MISTRAEEKEYVRRLFAKEDTILSSMHTVLAEQEMPQISVPPEIGKLLYMLIKASSAENILEIGTLGGYSTIWMARALPPTGSLISIELDSHHAYVAQKNVMDAGLADKVKIRTGDAIDELQQLRLESKKFDFFFIDADKEGSIKYLESAIILGNPGALIVADNLFQEGRIFDKQDNSPSPVAIRAFNQFIAEDSRLESILLTVGDGLGVCRIKER